MVLNTHNFSSSGYGRLGLLFTNAEKRLAYDAGVSGKQAFALPKICEIKKKEEVKTEGKEDRKQKKKE